MQLRPSTPEQQVKRLQNQFKTLVPGENFRKTQFAFTYRGSKDNFGTAVKPSVRHLTSMAGRNGSGLILNEETLSQLDRQNDKALYNSVDVGEKGGLRCMSQTVQYEKPFLKKGASTIETGELPTEHSGTTGTKKTRAEYLKQKRFSSTFS